MVSVLSALESSVDRAPNRPALVYGDDRLTYAELDAQVNRVAHVLAASGLGRGDRCALMGANTAGFVYAFFAVAKLGAVFVPVNPRSAPPEVAHVLRDSEASIVLADPGVSGVVDEALAMLDSGAPSRVLTIGPCDGKADVLELARAASNERPGVVVDESDDAIILYTSGTTGIAKGVLMDHHRLIWTGLSVPIGTLGMSDGDSVLHVAPLYHSGQITMMLIPGTLLAAKHVILSRFDAAVVLDTMERERTSVFFGVPTMYQLMSAEQARRPRDVSAWRTGNYGGAPMSPESAEDLQRTFGGVRLFSCYGQTEAGPSGFYSTPAQAIARPDVTGYTAFPTMGVRVVDADFADVEPGEVGEVLLRGESVMKGYWRNPAATAEAFHDGWLRTGDLARLDADGGMTIVDRLKDMIISGGRNVYSVEVENALLTHPAISDCAVLGRPDPVFGETIVAFVSLVPSESADFDELHAHCAKLIADYKLPREVIFSEIPRNPSGKIMKKDLRRLLAAGHR